MPASRTKSWLDALVALEPFGPKHIEPGHGRLTDQATARAQTRAVLEALHTHSQRAVGQGTDLSEAAKSFNVAPFRHLSNAGEWHSGDASRAPLEVERA